MTGERYQHSTGLRTKDTVVSIPQKGTKMNTEREEDPFTGIHNPTVYSSRAEMIGVCSSFAMPDLRMAYPIIMMSAIETIFLNNKKLSSIIFKFNYFTFD